MGATRWHGRVTQVPKKSKKRGSGGRREIGSAEKVAKKLARDSERVRKGATVLVGKIEHIESRISRLHEGIEDFHDSTEEIETSVQNVEDALARQGRREAAKKEQSEDSGRPGTGRVGLKDRQRIRR
jgi:t-SNARE complex subunit (syntaxin)